MANHLLRRGALQFHDTKGIFIQALIAFLSNIPLFIMLGLVSSMFEVMMERSSFLSDVSLSSPNTSFSIHFALDPKQRALYSPYKPLNTTGYGIIGSWFSRRLASWLSPEHEAAILETLEHNANEFMLTKQVYIVKDKDMLNPHESKTTTDVALDDPTHPQENKLEENEHEADALNDLSQVPSADDKLKRSPEDAYAESRFIGSQPDEDQSPLATIPPELVDTKHEDNDEYIVESNVDLEEEQDMDDEFPRLMVETVSNVTKVSIQETFIDSNELTFFTTKLLGGRGLDQGAMPQGGLAILLMLLAIAVAFAIFLGVVGFQHALVLGSVAYSVVTTHMGKRATLRQPIKASFKSHVGRLLWLAVLHATLHGLESIVLMKLMFGGVMEMSRIEDLVIRLASQPFAFLAPFMDVDATSIGMTIRISAFVGFDYLFDGIVYCIYIVACWVTIMETNYWGIGALSRSFNLMETMRCQAFTIRLIETVVCGRSSRWVFQQVFGQSGSALMICTLRIFFLVCWLIFYISARSFRDRPSSFSYETLEDFLDRFK